MKHSIFVCLVACLLPLMVACGGQEDSLPETNAKEAMLFLNVKPLGQTRAGVDDLPNNEKMHSLRVIVLHQDGSVEHNQCYTLDGAVTERNILLAVKAGEKKKIFFFANEESVASVEGVKNGIEAFTGSLTAFFDSYKKVEEENEGTEGNVKNDFEEKVKGLYFTPDYSQSIPMSSMYDIDALTSGTRIERDFYVARVATKFDVTITNNRSEAVTLKSFSVNSVATQSYLYPHFNDDAGIITENGKSGFVFNYETLPWIDWLKKVSDDSETYPGKDESTGDFYSDQRGWIMEYTVPTSWENHKAGNWNLTEVDKTPIESGGDKKLTTQYFPESCYTVTNENTDYGYLCDAAKSYEQHYKFRLEFEGKTFEEDLYNLRSLFRNTHVKINITINDTDVTWTINVRPWNLFTHDQIFM